MKNIKIYIILLHVLFFISITTIIDAKSINKYNDTDKLSNYFSGVISFRNKEYNNAYKYLKQLNGLESYHEPYSSIYQYSLLNLERFEETFKYAKKLDKDGIRNFENDLLLGLFNLRQKKYNLALEYFKRLKKYKSQGPVLNLVADSLNAWISLFQLNEKEGLKAINNLPQQYRGIKEIQTVLVNCYFQTPATVKKFEKLTLNTGNDFARYYYFHANYLLSQGKKNEALKIIALSLKSNPRNLLINQLKKDFNKANYLKFNNQFDCTNLSHNVAEIFYVISNILSSQSLYSLSNFYLNLAKYLNPEFISFETLYAENYYKLGNLTKSKKIHEKIKKKGSAYSWFATKNIATILSKEKKNKEALSYLTKNFMKIKKPNTYEIYDYAEFLKNNDQFEDSIIYFSKVLNLVKPNDYLFSKASDGRGVAYERLGDWAKAESDLLNSLKAVPNQAYVINYLAYSWIEQGVKIEKSLEMLEEANNLKKNDGYIIDSLGWALFKLKKFQEAKKYLEQAVKIMPTDPVINDHFGDSLWMIGKELQARYYWNYVLTLENTEDELKQKIKKKIIFGLNI